MKIKPNVRKKLNDQIFPFTTGLQESIPITDISKILKEEGITTEEFILTGREGRASIDLFMGETEIQNAALCLTWYKHDTGRYDVTAYVS